MMAGISHSKSERQLSAIRQLENDLINVLQHEIDVVLSKAWSMEIIGEQVQSLQSSSHSSRVKAQKFVHVIRDRIKPDPRTFDAFLTILRSTPSLGHLADGLEEKICQEHRIPSGSNSVADHDFGGVPNLQHPSMTSTPRSSLGNRESQSLWGVDSIKSTVTVLEEGNFTEEGCGFNWRGCFSVGGYHFLWRRGAF